MDNISEKIYKSAMKFLVPLNLTETYALVVSEAIKLLKAEYGSILLEQGGRLQRMYASDPAFYKIKIGKEDPMYEVMEKKKPVIFNRKEIYRIHPEIVETPVHSDLIAPLIYKNKSIGVLTLMSSKEKVFSQKDAKTVRLFSTLTSLAIRKAQLNDETKRALEAKDLFISMAAHELRTPLTTINGYIQLLQSRLSGIETKEALWMKELSREGERMIKLVREFLQIERIKTGKLQYSLKECSMVEVIKRAMLNLHFTNPDYKIVFQNKLKDHPDLVIGDFDKLTQVFINLLNNAVKFSNPSMFITIRLRYKAHNLILRIRDKGKGIAKKDLPRIFERYYRGSNPQVEGIGLGLFLVNNIIRQHRGRIEVRSKENKGTTIEIKLPAVKT